MRLSSMNIFYLDSVYTRNTFHHHNHRHRFGKLGNRPPYNEKAKMGELSSTEYFHHFLLFLISGSLVFDYFCFLKFVYSSTYFPARYIVHESSWGVLTTICTHNKGYPWGEVVSIADGLENNSTGLNIMNHFLTSKLGFLISQLLIFSSFLPFMHFSLALHPSTSCFSVPFLLGVGNLYIFGITCKSFFINHNPIFFIFSRHSFDLYLCLGCCIERFGNQPNGFFHFL